MANTTTKTVSSDTLNCISYNSMGWGMQKADFVTTLLIAHSVHVLALQETFILKDNTFKISQCFNDYEVFALPATKLNRYINSGRPMGGMAFLYKSSLCKVTTHISVPSSSRVQGLKINSVNFKAILINAYFPTDPRTNNFDDTELVKVLQDIKYILDQCEGGYQVILMGDLNASFSRNSHFTLMVKNFLDENNLLTVWSKFPCDYTYSQTREHLGQITTSYSTIDHFCVDSENIIACESAASMHMGDNLSCHSPIMLKLKCDVSNLNSCTTSEPPPSKSSPLWFKASSQQLNNFKSDLAISLNYIDIPIDAIYCRDVHCNHVNHRADLDAASEEVLDAISAAVGGNIPHSGINTEKSTPGWKEWIAPYKADARFWFAVWTSAGKPQGTQLHNIMKRTRNQFMYAVRRAKRHEDEIRKSKFINACMDGEVNDIIQDLRKSRCKNNKVASSIDGCTDPSDIANNFQNIYKNIFNTHKERDQVELESLIDDNNASINASDVSEVDRITPELVKNTILKFHNNKNDSIGDWKSNAFKVGIEQLKDPLCDLLKAFIVHGHIPKVFLICSLIPIVKDKNSSKLSSTNYRLIAITALLLKLFDHLLIELFQHTLNPSPHQFGFQKGYSTTMCTWALQETVNYFRTRGSSVFVCLLDLTKAFDLVRLPILFKKLGECISPLFLRFIICSYINQQCSVRWQGEDSNSFRISNGVRQGAVASPVFFNIYINNVFQELRDCGYGCYIGDQFCGAFAYADDVALLSPTREGLQVLVNLSESYFSKHGIKVSTNIIPKKSKTKVLYFGSGNPKAIILYGRELPYVEEAVHLGHLLHTDESPGHDMLLKRGEYIGKFHSLRQDLGKQFPAVYMKLISVYLLHLYGWVLWDIYSVDAQKMWTMWHTQIRSIFNLPFATHRYILQAISNTDHLKTKVIKRFLKFQNKLRSSDNPLIQQLYMVKHRDLSSTFGRNCSNISRDLHVDDLSLADSNNFTIHPVPQGEEWRINFIKELCDLRDNELEAQLSTVELEALMQHICCS